MRWVVGSILRCVARELSRDGPVIEVAAQVRGAMGRRIDPSRCGARDGPVIEVAAQVRGAMGRRIDPSLCGKRIE